MSTKPERQATAISHSAFPHIVSKIIAYCCPSSLKVLRATCKDVQAQCDGRLFAHARVSRDLVICLPKSSSGEALRATQTLSETASILDFDFALPCNDEEAASHQRFLSSKARTARILPRARDYYFYHGLTPWRTVLFVTAPQTSFCLNLPCKRLVINIATVAPDIFIPNAFQDTDVVVAFHPSALDPMAFFLRLRELSEVLRLLSFCATFTIVGVPQVHRDLIHTHVANYDDWAPDQNPDRRCRTVTFQSWSDFRQTSPHFALETDPKYHLTPEEIDVLLSGNEAAMLEMGL